MDFFSSIEFYVIMVVVAASIVVFSARPRTRGSMREYLLASRLREQDGAEGGDSPEIEVFCDESGKVTLTRRGLPDDITMSGAVSLAVNYDGVNLRMEERLTAGLPSSPRVGEAVFDLHFLGQGWYDAMYNSDTTGLFVAFKLHVRRGLRVVRTLQQ